MAVKIGSTFKFVDSPNSRLRLLDLHTSAPQLDFRQRVKATAKISTSFFVCLKQNFQQAPHRLQRPRAVRIAGDRQQIHALQGAKRSDRGHNHRAGGRRGDERKRQAGRCAATLKLNEPISCLHTASINIEKHSAETSSASAFRPINNELLSASKTRIEICRASCSCMLNLLIRMKKQVCILFIMYDAFVAS